MIFDSNPKGGRIMAKRFEIYRCEICGNLCEVLDGGKGELVCCGQPMTLLKENSTDAAQEKHVPVMERTEGGTLVKIGSMPHPMTEEHHIEWIQLITDDGVHSPRHYLKAGDSPETTFKLKNEKVMARAYCNLHGLWKKGL